MSRPRIEAPSAAGDRPRWGPLVAVAVTSLAAGLGLVYWTLGDADGLAGAHGTPDPTPDHRPDSADVDRGGLHEETHLGGVETEIDDMDSLEGVSEGATLDTVAATGDLDAESPEEDPGVVAPPSADPGADAEIPSDSEAGGEDMPAPPRYRLVPGRLAYLRCEGARPTAGPYPCPRDRDLERVVWQALTALAECPGRPQDPGEGDLRLTFARGALETLELRGSGAEALAEAPVLGCLREPLGGLATTIRAEDLVVSFRFALERR